MSPEDFCGFETRQSALIYWSGEFYALHVACLAVIRIITIEICLGPGIFPVVFLVCIPLTFIFVADVVQMVAGVGEGS